MNQIKTVFLLTSLTLFFIFIGMILGGSQGMLIAFLMATGMNFFAYFFSDKMALSAYNAKELDYQDSPWLHDTISELAYNANIPKPKIYVVQMGVPNAFATGRNPQNAAVAVTPEIMELLNANELRGVLAHELAHIKNRDILISSIAATIAGAISMLINFMGIFGARNSRQNIIVTILIAVLAPIAAMIIQMSISRSREYLADETGAMIARDPDGLASALMAISGDIERIKHRGYDEPKVEPNTAHMMIINPLGGWLRNMFSTHPSTEDRVARLKSLRGRL